MSRHGRRLLVIEGGGCSFEATLGRCGLEPAAFCCRSANRESVLTRPEMLHAQDLLLPVALDARTEALGFLTWVTTQTPRGPVLAVLPEAPDSQLLTLAAKTADDFILWRPDSAGELRQRIERIFGPEEATSAISGKLGESLALAKLIGDDPTFLAAVARIPPAARATSPVLILGETGTGKELCSRAIHYLSSRRRFPFVPVDCGALPDHLLENELFGHARGAFTDAHRDETGLVAMAEGGTLFLDEIDSLTLSAQAKLLRLLEERVYRPLGSSRFVHADIRIIAASNRNLEHLVRQNLFRSDLYFRVGVLELRLPPLRERRGDIPILARHFVDQVCAEARIPCKTVVPAALAKLAAGNWPGNVRELFNVIQRAIVFCEGPALLSSHISLAEKPLEGGEYAGGFREARASAVEAFERAYISGLLRRHNGNVTRSAREAGKDRRVFGRLMKKHNISRFGL